MSDNKTLSSKTLHFALRVIRLNKFLIEEKHEQMISEQILKSATLIGTSAAKAFFRTDSPDFSESLQAIAETEYWIKLLTISEYIRESEGESLLDDCSEIKEILLAEANKEQL